MKFLYQSLAFCGILLLSSCYKDHGNYDYSQLEEITVEGIESSYTKTSLVDRITLDPAVHSTDADAEFTYFWGIYETNVQGFAPKLDTIARTKALDYLVTQPAKAWVLVFCATNKKTGLSKIVESTVNVTTQFTRGWYVMKDDGTNSDVDLFLTPNSIEPESSMKNVFSLVNGKKLEGKARLFEFFSDYKTDIITPGRFANTRALFMLTDKDGSVVNINTFLELHPFSKLFYKEPDVKKPSIVCEGSSSLYLANDGRLHGIYTMGPSNTGMFGGAQLRDDRNTPYNLSKYYLTHYIFNPFFFDEASSSFVSATGIGSVLSPVADGEDSEMPANNNNKTLLFMGIKTGPFPYTGIAVFQDKSDPSLRILSHLEPAGYSLTIRNDTIAPADKIRQAERYALIYQDENILYFTTGSEVWSRNLSNGAERLQYTVPAGEQITFMRHRSYSGGEAYSFNYIMIGTASGGNYKIRMFTKTSGNLAATPDFTLEGEGNAGDVIYIAPNVNNRTYPDTY